MLKVSELLNNDSTSIKDLIFQEVEDITEQCEKYTQVFRVYLKGKVDLQASEFKRLKN